MRLSCTLTAVYVQSGTEVVAYIPEIPGALGQGPTIEEARASLADALEMVIASHRRSAWETFRECRVLLRESILSNKPSSNS